MSKTKIPNNEGGTLQPKQNNNSGTGEALERRKLMGCPGHKSQKTKMTPRTKTSGITCPSEEKLWHKKGDGFGRGKGHFTNKSLPEKENTNPGGGQMGGNKNANKPDRRSCFPRCGGG